jgi:hypothetical protein
MSYPARDPQSGIDGKANTTSYRCQSVMYPNTVCEVAA